MTSNQPIPELPPIFQDIDRAIKICVNALKIPLQELWSRSTQIDEICFQGSLIAPQFVNKFLQIESLIPRLDLLRLDPKQSDKYVQLRDALQETATLLKDAGDLNTEESGQVLGIDFTSSTEVVMHIEKYSFTNQDSDNKAQIESLLNEQISKLAAVTGVNEQGKSRDNQTFLSDVLSQIKNRYSFSNNKTRSYYRHLEYLSSIENSTTTPVTILRKINFFIQCFEIEQDQKAISNFINATNNFATTPSKQNLVNLRGEYEVMCLAMNDTNSDCFKELNQISSKQIIQNPDLMTDNFEEKQSGQDLGENIQNIISQSLMLAYKVDKHLEEKIESIN